jgi:hypothetical protein
VSISPPGLRPSQAQSAPSILPCPMVGAGLPGLLFASTGLLGWWRRPQRTYLKTKAAWRATGCPSLISWNTKPASRCPRRPWCSGHDESQLSAGRPSRRGIETRACPLRQLRETLGGWGASVSTCRGPCELLGSEDVTAVTSLLFDPIIFWTTTKV